MSERKTVWVLGAGFSRPLGGPTLKSLLSITSRGDLAVRYPGHAKLDDATAQVVRLLYLHGLQWPDGPVALAQAAGGGPGERLWSDAEEFLDYLDTAAGGSSGNPHAMRVERIQTDHLGQRSSIPSSALAASARHVVAAECCAFLEGVSPMAERWKPFRSWEYSLGPSDTIVTFNYDRVVERLVESHEEVAKARGRVVTIRPGHVDEDTKAAQAAPGYCQMLKLHGSVDWKLCSASVVEVMDKSPTKNPTFAIDCPDKELAIAAPGPSKATVTGTNFGRLWELALEALRSAEVIVFIGYRFPPTDADAREKLLGAIRGNIKPRISLHTVLGEPGFDSKRLAALLRFACQDRSEGNSPRFPGISATPDSSYELHSHPLFGQDFLSVFQRDRLFP